MKMRDKNRLCAGVATGATTGAALTLLETIIALVIMTIVFAAVLPQFRVINNSWDSKQAGAEVLQNGRVLIDHINRNLSKAVKITDVSVSSETDGYIEFEDNDGNSLRYEIDTDNYVEFGPVGELSDLAGLVSTLQFTCYDGNDFGSTTTDVNSIRFVEVQTTLPNPATLGQDKTFMTNAYLRTNGNPIDGGGNETVRDEFKAVSYSGNDGTQDWSNDWQEGSDSRGPEGGLVCVDTDYAYSSPYALNLAFLGEVWRQADLSGATSAELTYHYEGAGWGGIAWVTVDDGSSQETVTYGLGSGPSGSAEINISEYISDETKVYFGIFALGSVGFDDIQIEYGSGSQLYP